MELTKMKISDIIPYENNPRKNDGAVGDVMESIRQCGYVAPIIVDENNVVLAGHTRLKAAKKLGWKELEVIVRAGLTEEQKKKYRILDNKTNELAEWDFTKLEEELGGLDFSGFSFDFDMPTWESMSGGETTQKEEQTVPKFTPEGVKEGNEGDEDPYEPEGYDDDEIKEYTENQERYLVKRRVIITYLPELEPKLKEMLGISSDELKVVYDIEELLE